MTTVKDIVKRISIFYALVVLLSLAITGRIIYLQFFTDYKDKAKEVAVKKEFIEAGRGNVFAHNGKMLATSLPVYEIRMDFAADGIVDSVFNRDVGALAKSLASLFGDKNANAYTTTLKNNRKNKQKHRYERIGNRYINFIELQKLKEFPIFILGKNKGGLIVLEKTKRHYPYGSLAYRTIGYVNSNDEAQVGIEHAFNKYLKGQQGSRLMQRIAGSQWMPINSEYDVQPQTGYDVVSTLDVDIQDAAEQALRRQIQKQSSIEGGTAIVMDVATGEIRAIANMKRNSSGGYDESYNYAISETSPPGSTFKLATLIALLDDGLVTLNDMVETSSLWVYNKHKFREAGGHNYGKINVKKVFAKSSNVGFAKLVVKHYGGKPQKFIDKLRSMGLFQKSMDLQIAGENRPHITEPSDKRWNPQLLPLTAIGYEATIAPIHTLVLYNAVANNGRMMKPKFVKEIRQHGQTVEHYPDEVIKEEICSKETLFKVREALESVVDSGTARHIRESRFTFAGKTGTAQRVVNGRFRDAQGRQAYQATFAAYFPAEQPKYSIVVVLYSPPILGNFYGGTWAAPVFKEIVDKIYSTELDWFKPIERTGKDEILPKPKKSRIETTNIIARDLDFALDNNDATDWAHFVADSASVKANSIEITEGIIPSVVNMGLKDAVFLLENLGLNVSFSGKGSVSSQSLSAGTKIIKGQNIHLSLEI